MQEEIIRIVSTVTGISVENILAQNRHIPYTDARKIAMSLSVRYTSLDYTVIADFFKKDRSTVGHACSKSLDLIETENKFRNHYSDSERLVIEAGYELFIRDKRPYKKKKSNKKFKKAA